MTIRDWNAIHPLIVHFPIALLLVAPAPALIGLCMKQQRAFLFAALVLMTLGTIATWVAVSSGEAARELSERVPAAQAVLERHEEMAETTGTLFSALTLVYGAMLFVPLALKREPRRFVDLAAHGAFLAVYLAAGLYLVQTAHPGGVLVHQYGVHAPIGPAPAFQASDDHDTDD